MSQANQAVGALDGALIVRGRVKMELFNSKGELKKMREGPNAVVTAGKNLVAQVFSTTGGVRPTHIAIGTSSTAVSAAQTALVGTELARTAFNTTHPSRTNNAVAYKSAFGAGVGTGTVEEAGVFNSATAGSMLSRFLTGTFVKGASDTLDVTWTLTFGT